MPPTQTNTEPVPITLLEKLPLSVQPVVAPTALEKVSTKKLPRQRHFLITFFFSFMWGSFGADRFYMGYIGTGIIKLLTFGGFGIWTIIDLFVIMAGAMKDKQDQDMLQFAEYKKFAQKTVLWFAILLGLFILINGILLILGVFQLITSFQNGSIPGLNSLTGGGSDQQSQINSLIKQ